MYICCDIIIVSFSQIFMLHNLLEKYLEIGLFLDFSDFSVKNGIFPYFMTELKVKNNNFMLILNKKTINNRVNKCIK